MSDRFAIPGGQPLKRHAERATGRRHNSGEQTGNAVIHAATFAVWFGCGLVTVLGLLLPYPRPQLSLKEPAAVVVETVQVALKDSAVEADSGKSARAEPESVPPPVLQKPASEPPAAVEAMALPEAPPLATVAAPNPAIAFADPVQGPSHGVDARQAISPPPNVRPQAEAAPPARAVNPSAPVVRHLTFGVGDGAQPSPEYPREAVISGQQGTVHVSFTVGRDGKVMSAELSPGCRWPLLNQAALCEIREKWPYPPGPVRRYDISIEFKLNEQ